MPPKAIIVLKLSNCNLKNYNTKFNCYNLKIKLSKSRSYMMKNLQYL